MSEADVRSSEPFDSEEEDRLARALRDGEAVVCPRCTAPLDVWPVPPRGDVSYVRDRVRLVCPSCRRTTVLERRDLR
jgi:hypothetical protein